MSGNREASPTSNQPKERGMTRRDIIFRVVPALALLYLDACAGGRINPLTPLPTDTGASTYPALTATAPETPKPNTPTPDRPSPTPTIDVPVFAPGLVENSDQLPEITVSQEARIEPYLRAHAPEFSADAKPVSIFRDPPGDIDLLDINCSSMLDGNIRFVASYRLMNEDGTRAGDILWYWLYLGRDTSGNPAKILIRGYIGGTGDFDIPVSDVLFQGLYNNGKPFAGASIYIPYHTYTQPGKYTYYQFISDAKKAVVDAWFTGVLPTGAPPTGFDGATLATSAPINSIFDK